MLFTTKARKLRKRIPKDVHTIKKEGKSK